MHETRPDPIVSHPIGQLTRMVDPSGTTTYCYDPRGNVTRKQMPGDVEIAYEYNAADRLMAITYPSGRVVSYTRDATGQITFVILDNPFVDGQVLTRDIQHLPFGPPSSYTFGFGSSTQILERTYDLDYQITDVTSPALNLHFRRDPVGNIDRLGNAPGAGIPVESYHYDPLYRLQVVEMGLGFGIVEAYTYDAIGNRLSKAAGGPGVTSYDYAIDSHRLIQVGSHARHYDAAGNLISDQADNRIYTYGDHNRLMGFSGGNHSASYHYNGRGERVLKSVQSGVGTHTASAPALSTHFFYDEAGRLLAEHSASMPGPIDTFREYVYVDDIPVALIDYDGSIYHIHADHLGTPRAVTDNNSVKRWEWMFQSNPFGEQMPNEDPLNTGSALVLNLRFPGQYFDFESGLYYNYFRDYESSTGRYMQSDPHLTDRADPELVFSDPDEPYHYASGNPLIYIDPDGLQSTVDLCMRRHGPEKCGLGKPPPKPKPKKKRNSKGWTVYCRCNINKQRSCDPKCPNTIGGRGNAHTYGLAKSFCEKKAKSNFRKLNVWGCQTKHCHPIRCFRDGRLVPCPGW